MMNRSKRRAVLRGMAATMVAPMIPTDAFAAIRAGEVETSHGDCFASALAARRPLAPDTDVFMGESVGTGINSSLGLLLGAATRVQLGAESQLRIDRFIVNAGGVLRLDRGAILYDHDPKDGPDNVTIRSSFGLLAVRGTRFFAGPSNDAFGVFVERGALIVVGMNTSVSLTHGLGTDIAAPGRTGALLPSARLFGVGGSPKTPAPPFAILS